MTLSEKLIYLFNQLDDYLRIKHFNNSPSYMSFSRKIYYLKKHRLEPLFENKRYFDMLRKASDIRNIIAHNNDLVVPNEVFVREFEELVSRITKPKTLRDVMTPFQKLKTLRLTDRLSDGIELFKQYGFASIPIVENKHLIGFLTEKTMFDFLTVSDQIIDKQMRIHTLLDVINLDKEPRAYFQFVSKDLTVDDGYVYFLDDFKKKHELILLLVTEHGRKDERLLGIVALRDLKNELY